ncbi:C2 domain-containing protein 5 isoform X3 [Zerene cesonia]|uniref:C2 domain-containing protein 5 isoform X3 n=1 Tax=Zerene cesonia TaxID=33412 RepID=UPI0018E5A7AE|nr:C2 domain-containing protein 5 isoform X3 [Zerene cesonia]
MPGKIKVKVLAGRNLPVMDRASDTTDAFVEVKFGGVTHKTDVCRKSLNPQWNSTEWYRFEVDESELQDEPLQLRLMDHDTYSANDAIGKVVISLAPLLAREANNTNGIAGPPGGAVMSGWIPVFDTMHGIRGELNVIVKVELFSDFNKYKTSSCGVQFFHCPMIPPGYRVSAIHGFVEELIVNDDPEYQWIDKIRTPRASNEARQVAFIKLSNQVQRLVGLKAAELGANAVVGYQQDFDLEGEAGVVARAIGTAVSITPLPLPSQPMSVQLTQQQLKKYLDILATEDDSVDDLKEYYQHHQDELQMIVNILNPRTPSMLDEPENNDDDDRTFEMIRPSPQSYYGSQSIYQDLATQRGLKHISEDQSELNRLLNRQDSDSDSSGAIGKIKKIKTNLFSKRFVRRRKSSKQDDQVSIKSNSSDTSRISEIKNELKKLKRLNVRKYDEDDEGINMASILARSVLHAQTSLARISESQDSEHSPGSTIRRISESESVITTTNPDQNPDKETGIQSENKIPEIHCASMENLPNVDNPQPERKISESCPTSPVVVRTENLLKLPGDVSYYGSVSSALSAESSDMYSTSDEEEDSYGMKSDTISSVVKSVLRRDVGSEFIAQMERKLTSLNTSSFEKEDCNVPSNVDVQQDKRNESNDVEPSAVDDKASLSGPSSIYSKDEHHFREQRSFKKEKPAIKPAGLVHTAMETILIDKVQSLLIPTSPDFQSAEKKFFDDVNERLESVEAENKAKDTANNNAKYKKERKLIRQDSIHSKAESIGSLKMSKENTSNVATPCKLTHTPVLQNFHPILSGAHLETIPSLPESGVDRSESLDVEGVESECDTNSASVCGNSHAACDLDRDKCEREKGDREKCERDKDRGSPRHARHESYGGREPAPPPAPSLHSTSTPLGIHRRSSDSDLSITPKGGSLNASLGNTGSGGGAILRPSMNSNNLDMLEYPFLTMTEYPPGFIVHIGGTVCARSVKLVDGGGGGESGSRAAWWAELRTELRAHARALRCPAVLAYCERAAVREDVCVLSASGTAAVINLDCDFNTDEPYVSLVNGSKNTIEESENESCSIAHVPYSPGSGPYRAELATCGECRRARVPTVLLATCSKPNRLTSYGKAVTLTAVAGRIRRAPPAAEPGARDISDQLPFLEYELHKLLLAKLRMQGANAIFSLQTQIAIGERCVMALAAGTAVRLAALPPPAPPRIKATENDKDALEIQKALWDAFTANKAANGYDIGTVCEPTRTNDIEGEEPPALDLCADKDACLLELDEAEDVETAKLLASRRNNMQVYTNALKPSTSPHAQPYAFMQVWRTRLGAVGPSAERLVASALSGAAYKLRRLQPAALAPPAFQLDLPEDEIQLVVSGTALPLQDPTKVEHTNGTEKELQHEDDIFALDEDQLVKSQTESNDERATGPVGRVSLSTLAQVSGSRCARRVCALRLLFVRETTGVRELGGLSGFLHTFTCEVLAIVRAYTAALGGNALTSFYVTHLMLQDNAHKNQGQCLLSVGGDVVHITY